MARYKVIDANPRFLAADPALIADNGMRARDARFKTQARHKQKPDPLYNKAAIDPPRQNTETVLFP